MCSGSDFNVDNAKLITCIFMAVLLIVGVLAIVEASIGLNMISTYKETIGTGHQTPNIIVMLLGIVLLILFLVSVFALCRESSGIFLGLAYCVLAMGIVMFIVGLIMYIHRYNEKLTLGMQKHMETQVMAAESHKNLFKLQEDFECCGINDFRDYTDQLIGPKEKHGKHVLPRSCCKGSPVACLSTDYNNYNKLGCYETIKRYIQVRYHKLAFVCLLFAPAMFIGSMIYSLYSFALSEELYMADYEF